MLVVVVNMQSQGGDGAPPHRRFEEAQRFYAAPHPKAQYFLFLDGRPTPEEEPLTKDPKAHATAHNDPGTPNKPGYRVRKQTRNIALVMRRCESRARFYLFLEDDMRFCPSGLQVCHVLPRAPRCVVSRSLPPRRTH